VQSSIAPSSSLKSRSPAPRKTGTTAKCNSSPARDRKSWWIVEAPPDDDVPVARRGPGQLEGGLRAIGHEVERRATGHLQRFSRMMRQYEDRMVERRIISPPSIPPRLGPLASHQPEHVATHNGGTYFVEPFAEQIVIQALIASGSTVHLSSRSRFEDPFVE